MKKFICLICGILLLTSLLVGCTSGKTTNDSTDSNDKSNESDKSKDTQPKGIYMTFNGTSFTLGMPYADVKDGLGAQTEPEEVILPCDGGDSYKNTIHHYPGFTVTENKDGIICEIDFSTMYGEGDASLMGKIKIGSTQAEAVEALGTPDNYPLADDDFALSYSYDDKFVIVFLDSENNKETVSGASFMLMDE